MTRNLTINLPSILPHQRSIVESDARHKVPACGRRFGKTTLGRIMVTDGHGPRQKNGKPRWRGAAHNRTIWWIAPTYGVLSLIWLDLKRTLAGVWVAKNEVEHRIDLPGHGSITAKSGEKPDLLRGPGLDGVVIDEAAHQSEDVWRVIRPALADRGGWSVHISTPKGLNHYHRLFLNASGAGDWAAWQQPTSDNPLISPAEIEDMRTEIGPFMAAQELEAQFVSPEGAVFNAAWFRYYRTDGDLFILAQPDGTQRAVSATDGYRFGTVDLAASLKTTADYFVVAAWHVTKTGDLVLLDLFRERVEGPDQVPAMRRMMDRWNLGWVWVEKAGYQLAMIQIARREGLPVRELVADRDKVARSMPLQARMESGAVYFPLGAPWLAVAEGEILAFPEGEHDDIADVMSYAAHVQARHLTRRPSVTRA